MTLPTALFRFLAFALLTAAPAGANAQKGSADPFFDTLLKAQEAIAKQGEPLENLVKQANFTGSIGLVTARGDEQIWHYQRTRADELDNGFDSTIWRWASITKQVVAVLVLQEVGKGTIDLDRPIVDYLPNFASSNAGKITTRMLLRHQSGLPNPDDTLDAVSTVAAYYRPEYKSSRDPLQGYCAGPVKGEPGGNWDYNNCDYIVAGALLEAVTGTKWSKLVEKRITKPLGLTTVRSAPERPRTRSGLIAGKSEPAIDLAAYAAAGALQGSPSDLLRFDRALMGGRLLGPKELEVLWDGRPELGQIALGQWVYEAPLKGCAKSVRLVERRGAIGGIQVRNFIAPERKIALVVFTDKGEGDFAFGEIWQGSGFSYDALSAVLCTMFQEPK